MELKFKKVHPQADIPVRANPGDAGLDLTAVKATFTDNYVEYGTGIAVEIPEGFVGLLFPRSSASKYPLPFALANSVGVIDSGYRGEIKARFRYKLYNRASSYNIGDKVCQLVIVPIVTPEPVEVEELESSDRGEGGFGSTGK